MSIFIEQLKEDLIDIRKDLMEEVADRQSAIDRCEAALREINMPDKPPVRRAPTRAVVKVGDGVVAGSASGEVI